MPPRAAGADFGRAQRLTQPHPLAQTRDAQQEQINPGKDSSMGNKNGKLGKAEALMYGIANCAQNAGVSSP